MVNLWTSDRYLIFQGNAFLYEISFKAYLLLTQAFHYTHSVCEISIEKHCHLKGLLFGGLFYGRVVLKTYLLCFTVFFPLRSQKLQCSTECHRKCFLLSCRKYVNLCVWGSWQRREKLALGSPTSYTAQTWANAGCRSGTEKGNDGDITPAFRIDWPWVYGYMRGSTQNNQSQHRTNKQFNTWHDGRQVSHLTTQIRGGIGSYL